MLNPIGSIDATVMEKVVYGFPAVAKAMEDAPPEKWWVALEAAENGYLDTLRASGFSDVASQASQPRSFGFSDGRFFPFSTLSYARAKLLESRETRCPSIGRGRPSGSGADFVVRGLGPSAAMPILRIGRCTRLRLMARPSARSSAVMRRSREGHRSHRDDPFSRGLGLF
jgi:hypothetical protein